MRRGSAPGKCQALPRDLRDDVELKSPEILGAISSSFNDFLKKVVIDEKNPVDEPIILICDTGQKSRVAANILIEDADFEKVYNLSGGTERWKKHIAKKDKAPTCCHPGRLVALCKEMLTTT